MTAHAADVAITQAELRDRLYGGWAGQLIGGIEGLAHEFKYNEQPAAALPVFDYLPGGARTDDDNDFEWTHLWFMDREGTLKLPYERIVAIWKANMNSGLWVANKRARELMDQGLVPPETGSQAHNEHAWYNLSGQFCTESFGLIAPGMPRAAADLGLHYARIAVSGEPLQATQYWTALISLSMVGQPDLQATITAALAAVDPRSAMAEVVADARAAHAAHPADWRAGRAAIHAKWHDQRKWGYNSTPLNGGAVILALLYGQDDFDATLRYAMALGYDADCNAATAGTVLGARWGWQRISALPRCKMPDLFVNKTRPELPATCRVSEQADLLLRLAERVILANGGEAVSVAGQPGWRIKVQEPAVSEPLRGLKIAP
ncbi:MAG: ADP-ribosylglycohydrolase family protein [Armatimonadetes bacterium]|nr:ADP-ribosylglycohydrolase family protein [Armatimonadota bacterium]